MERLSTRVAEMTLDHGRIVEVGAHDDLVRRAGSHASLHGMRAG